MLFKPQLQLVRLKGWSIFEQLQLEEACLRADHRNWCIFNEGSSPSIVMGISGNPQQLVNQDLLRRHPIPIIRRFSGGGTVFVDENTIFVSLICNSDDVAIPRFPKKILGWVGELYQPLFEGIDFRVKENDFVVGNMKFGGNAQYLCKSRWLHHSSLLWDFSSDMMNYLKIPVRMPAYRRQRSHNDFLCRLSDHLPEKESFYQKFLGSLSRQFVLRSTARSEIAKCLNRSHRKSTQIFWKKNC